MARTDLEQLQFQMAADISGLQKQLKKALDQTKDTSDKMDKHMGGVFKKAEPGKALEQIFSRSRLALVEEGGAKIGVFGAAIEHLGPAGLAAAAGLAALGLGLEEAHKAVEYADALYKMAAGAHVSTDALQEYQFALRKAGGNEADAAAGLADFSKKLGDAQKGMPKALKQFESLGFSAPQIKSWKDAETALPIVADAISKLKSSALQDSAISGTGLDGLKLLIEQGPEKMREFMAEAKSAGVVMDEHLVKRGHDLNEELETLNKKISIDLKSAFIDLAPILIRLATLLEKMAGWAEKVASAFAPMKDKSNAALQEQRDFVAARLKDPIKRALTGDRDRRELSEIDAEMARRAKEDKAPKPTGSGGLNYQTGPKGPTAADMLAKGKEALASAQKDALAAEAALTDNAEKLVALKSEEIDRETAKKDTQLEADIADKKINEALGWQAIEENDKAADLKKEKVRRDASEKLDDEYFATQQRVAATYDQIASINASLARTVQARLEIERAALLQRQKEDRAALQREFDRQKAHGSFLQSNADMLTATQRDQQAAEMRQLEQGAANDFAGNFKDLLSGAVDALRNKKDVMEYLADSFGEKLLSNLEDVAAQWLAKQFLASPQGSVLGTIGSIFGHRAGGGDVPAGRPVVVGESGQEVFVPGVSGTVISNRMLNSRVGGGRGVVYLSMPIDARGAMMAQDFIAYVDRSKTEAIRTGAAYGMAGAAQIVPARMSRSARQRYG